MKIFEEKYVLNNSYQRKEAAEQLSQIQSRESIQLLLNLLKDDNIHVKKQAIESLGKIGKIQADVVASALLPLTTADNIHFRRETVKALGEMGSALSAKLMDKVLNTLATIARKPQEMFGIRIKAVKALGKLGTEAAAKRVIQIATEESGEYKDSYRFAAYQALQHTDFTVALAFLKQELKQLAKQKQQWRKQRDHEKDLRGFENLEGLSTSDCTTATVVEDEKRWRYGHWETELGYAIAQHDPETSGLEMLAHPLANVRQGAWFGIAKIGVPTVALIQKIYQQREQSNQAYFRHAAFRSIDKNLITIEVFGKNTDLAALQTWLPTITDNAVRDRVEFTVAELEYRLRVED